MSETREGAWRRQLPDSFFCPHCGHSKVFHYGPGGACEARVVPADGVHDYALLDKCVCPGKQVPEGAAYEADSD